MWRCVKSRWKVLVLGAMLSVLAYVATLSLLAVSGWLICAAAFAGVTGVAAGFNYFIPAAGIRFLALLRIVARYAERLVTHDATLKCLQAVRGYCYRALLPTALIQARFFQQSDLLQRFVQDIDMVDEAYLRFYLPVGLTLFFFALFLLCFGVHFKLSMTFIWICAALSMCFLAGLYRIIVTRSEQAVCDQHEALRALLINVLQAPMELTLYGMKPRCQALWESLNHSMVQHVRVQGLCRAISAVVLMGLMGWLGVWLFQVGAMAVTRASTSVALFAVWIFIWLGLFESILALPDAFQAWVRSRLALRRLQQITQCTPAVAFPAQSRCAPTDFDIAFDRVSFSYPTQPRRVLDNVSVSIPQGARVAILGESGVGKTTLATLLFRMWDPAQGIVRIGGIDSRQFTQAQLRDYVAFAASHTHIFNDTVAANLRVGRPDATDAQLWSVLKVVQLEQVIRKRPDQLEAMMGEFGYQFSGGEKKRLGIARALLTSAPIVITDEPSEGCDPTTYQRLVQSVADYLHNRTWLVITHDTTQLSHFDAVFHLLPGGKLVSVQQLPLKEPLVFVRN